MNTVVMLLQVVIALGIANVWLLRSARSTAYRGGDAQNLTEEFAVYGLPRPVMLLVGACKLGCAAALLAGLFLPGLTQWAAIGMALLMVGAVSMHIKVGDPVMKALPASAMLIMSAIVAYFA